MRAFARWLNRLLWLALAVAVIGSGALVALGRHYAPLLERHTDDVMALVSERSGLQLRARAVRAEWHRFAPRFELEGVELLDPASGEPLAGIEQFTFRLNLGASLQRLTPVLSGVTGAGLFAVLEERSLGEWRLRGFDGPRGGGGGLADLLLAVRSARIGDSRVELRFFNGGRAELRGALRLERKGSFRRLLMAMATSGDGAPVELTLEARGDPRDADGFSARGFAQFNGVDLTSVLPLARNLGLDLRHGRIDGRVWLDWDREGSFTLRGEVGVPQLDLAALVNRPVPPVNNIRARFVMQERPGERQLWLPEIEAEWGATPIRFERLWLAQRGKTPHLLQLAVPTLDVAAIAGLLGSNELLPEFWREALNGLAPQGTLRDVAMTLPLGRAQLPKLLVRARAEDAAIQHWHGVPGITGGNGYVEVDVDGGRAWLASPRVALDFPGIYDAPIVITEARGRVDWLIAAGRVQLRSGTLAGRADAAQARGRFALDLPLHAGAELPPRMTLSIGIRDGVGEMAPGLIPNTLSDALRDLLAQADLAGRAPEAGFLFRGSLRAADDKARTVQLFVDIDGGGLVFHPEWPRLHGIAGELWIDDSALVARADAARLYEALVLTDVTVALRPVDGGSVLQAAASADGEGDDWLRLLRETPLGDSLGAITDRLHWSGPATATAALAVPLGAAATPLAVQVEGALQGGTLGFMLAASGGQPDLSVEQLQGAFSYRQGPALADDVPPPGVAAPALTGLLRHRPLRATLATAADGAVEASVDTTLAVDDWRALVPIDAPWLRGATRAQGALRWKEGLAELTVRSGLVGLAIDLPTPYNKPPEIQLPLALHLESEAPDAHPLDARVLNARARGSRRAALRQSTRTRVNAELGDWLQVALNWSGGTVRSGSLRFGDDSDSAAPRRRGSLVITGQMAAIDAAAWRDPVQRLWQGRGTGTGTGTAPSPDEGLAVAIADLRIPQFSLGDFRLDDVRLDGARLSDRWELQARSAQASGRLTLPRVAGVAPRLQLAELRLPRWRDSAVPDHPVGEAPPSTGAQPDGAAPTVDTRAVDGLVTVEERAAAEGSPLAAEGSPPAAEGSVTAEGSLPTDADSVPAEGSAAAVPADLLAAVNPANLPLLDVTVDRLWLGDEEWGSLGFELRPVPDGVAVQQLRGELRGLQLGPRPDAPARLAWTRVGGVDATALDLRLAVTNIGQVMERWGFERAILGRRGHLDVAVGWSGTPTAFDVAQLSGAAVLQVEEGRFLKAPTGTAGALKVVGVFNLANLVRRLRLDFTDFFSEGIEFDEIDGSFRLDGGRLATVRPLTVTSPSSSFRLSGTLDFAPPQVDMELVVTLPLASNLPWVAALAGGLPAAAGVYIASKLFGERVDRYSSAVYHVTGPWDEPTIRFRRIFDEAREKSRADQNVGAVAPGEGGAPE